VTAARDGGIFGREPRPKQAETDDQIRVKSALRILRKRIDNVLSGGYNDKVRGSAGIGRQARLRGVCASVWVQVPSAAPKKITTQRGGYFLWFVIAEGLEAAPAA